MERVLECFYIDGRPLERCWDKPIAKIVGGENGNFNQYGSCERHCSLAWQMKLHLELIKEDK